MKDYPLEAFEALKRERERFDSDAAFARAFNYSKQWVGKFFRGKVGIGEINIHKAEIASQGRVPASLWFGRNHAKRLVN